MSHRVCLSTPEYPPELGGVSVASKRLARTLSHAGFEVHVVTPCRRVGQAIPAATCQVEELVHVHRLYHEHDDQRTSFALRALIRELDQQQRFHLFHGFFLTAVYPCLSAIDAGGTARPLIASIRGSDAVLLKNLPLSRAVILAGVRRAHWITSVNQAYLDLLSEDLDICERASVIRNSVEPSPASQPPWSLGPNNRGVIGTVGQLRKVKDIPLLVRAYARLPAAWRRALLLAGWFEDAEEADWSWTLAREFCLADEVTLTGPLPHDRVFDHLRAMHVYVQCSAFEGLPNALLEAASLGVPLVATAVGGMAEVLHHEVNALLVPHGDPQALATAIGRVLREEGLAMQLSAGARCLAEQLNHERESAAWLALYQRLIPESANAD